MKNLITSCLLVTVVLLTGCGLKGISIPADKKDYIGYWTAPDMKLSISESGRVEYEKTNGGSKKSISAPIQKFEGNNFVVGALGINTTFVVSQPPAKDSSGTWTMVVDGVTLTK